MSEKIHLRKVDWTTILCWAQIDSYTGAKYIFEEPHPLSRRFPIMPFADLWDLKIMVDNLNYPYHLYGWFNSDIMVGFDICFTKDEDLIQFDLAM